MSEEVRIPSVGESVSEGTISQWHKADGDVVEPGDVLLTLETDKVSQEIECETGGILRIKVEEGEDVEIGAVVAVIEEGDGGGGSAPAEEKKEEPAETEEDSSASEEGTSGDEQDDMLIAPAVRALADEHGIDLSSIRGSGNRGRITKADVETIIQKKRNEEARLKREQEAAEEEEPPAPEKKSSPAPVDQEGRTTRKKMSPLRRKIATHLVNAQQTAAILTTFNECDMTAIMNLRKEVQEGFVAKHGVKLGFMSFFVKAVVDALKSVPAVNGMIDGNDIIQNHFYDIGVAIGTEKGLIVPVVKDCDTKSFADIEKDIISYATKAKEGKIEISDLQGGVFTISNGGVYGSLLSTPILNPPQSAILGMHSIQQRPVGVNGKVELRPMMYLAMSYDHRLVDGKEAVTFLIRIKDCIENPSRLLVGA